MCKPILALIAGILIVFASDVRADGLNYAFKAGKDVVYEVTFKVSMGELTQTDTYYLLYRARDVNPDKNQATLNYVWLERDLQTAGFGKVETKHFNEYKSLSKKSLDSMLKGKNIIINNKGEVIDNGGADKDRQLPFTLGRVYELMLLPLPDAGQKSWTTQKQLPLISSQEMNLGNGRRENVRAETMGSEVSKFTAEEIKNGLLTVHRNYEVTSDLKVRNLPMLHFQGQGQYVYSVSSGLVQSYEMNYSQTKQEQNETLEIKLILNVRLLTDDEFAAIQKKLDDEEVKNDQASKPEVDKQNADISGLPEGTFKSEMMGSPTGGSPYVRVNPDNKPVIGFKVEVATWGSHKCFRTFYPLFEPTKDKKNNEVIVMARDGYAVGGIIVNAKDGVNAVSVIFMKKTENGLDTKTSYNSPWYGEPMDGKRTKLGGTGQMIYGTFGRQGLNVDAMGLVIDSTQVAVNLPATKPTGLKAK